MTDPEAPDSHFRKKLALFVDFDRLMRIPNARDDRIDPQDQVLRRQLNPFSRSNYLSRNDHPDADVELSPQVIKATPAGAARPGPRGRLATVAAGDSIIGATPSTLVRSATVPSLARVRALGKASSSPAGRASPAERDHPVQTSKDASRAGAKRKREADIPDPAPDMLFFGLEFYYIPDNDVSPLRKMRIVHARKNGAVWARTMADATHVVVDNDLKWEHIASIVANGLITRAPGLPRPIFTNENYPVDSITFKTLLNPDQDRYHIPGDPAASSARQPARKPSRESTPGPSGSPDSPCSPGASPRPDPDGQRAVIPETPPTGSPPPPGRPAAGSESLVVIVPDSDVELEDSDPVVPTGRRDSIAGNTATEAAAAAPPRPAAITDELSEYVAMMQEYGDLPLDDSEDDSDTRSVAGKSDELSPSESDRSDGERRVRKRLRAGGGAGGNRNSLATEESVELSSSESGRSDGERRVRKRRRAGGGAGRNRKSLATEEKFACHQGGTRHSETRGPNARTIVILDKMCGYYTRVNDHWRTLAYRKAISTLRRQTTRIATEEEAYRLPNVGRRLAAKIAEIAATDRLQRLENVEAEPLTEVTETFLKVYGVGSVQASKWIARGLRTLDDLRTKARLTPNQRLGVDRFHDLNTRIPRAEVEALGRIVRRAAAGIDPGVELIVGGSYRRGAEYSGDVDFVVTKKGTEAAADLAPFLGRLIARLESDGVVVASVASSLGKARPGGGAGSKWHGCAVVPGTDGSRLGGPVWRRIDFLLVPETQLGAALLYFTGNDIFNRSMRLLAGRKGMRLNQRGLYAGVLLRGPGRARFNEGELVEGRSERRIFEILGVRWREPHERWC